MSIIDAFGIGPVADLIKKILNYFPDAQQRADAQKHLEDLVAAAKSEQVQVNKAEAETGSLFLAGWRPFVAWNCGVVFCLNLWFSVFGIKAFDSETATQTLYLLLGLGTWRTADKLGGVVTTAIKKILSK